MEGNKIIAEYMGYDDTGHLCQWEYHSSWDWLKKVVDEIEMRCQGVPQELLHLSLFSTRQEVYKAVVEFIKNQTK